MKSDYYVYALTTEKSGKITYMGMPIDISVGHIYYVGKGRGQRAYSGYRNADCNLFKKHFGAKTIILKDQLTEKNALDWETHYIIELSNDYLLTNRRLEHYVTNKWTRPLILPMPEESFQEFIRRKYHTPRFRFVGVNE